MRSFDLNLSEPASVSITRGSNHNRRGRFDMAITQTTELPEFSKLILVAARLAKAGQDQEVGEPVDVMTGGTYRTRGGVCVGPLRPFRDEEDGDHTDAEGRSAWFFVDGVGAYDRYGCILSGVPADSELDCVSTWDCGLLLESAA
ncbi:hypothetical protein NKJ46_25515 [Mesorhizobium sp. M0166]|uniref:hypothetical protein n=1 Tax=unclassified Mesorhizobium TaxID=325217 RepID=UPI0033388610